VRGHGHCGPPRPVEELPGFAQGWFAVQDAGAQLAAEWLGVADGMRVLDACAAPGGKTLHLAGLAQIELDALDVDAARAARIEDGLARLQPHLVGRVRVQVADAADRAQLRAATAGAAYDRILLDAPCTASGIVRRHPDIPWLRRPADVAKLATQQRRLLEALWPLLRPTGRLLYVVCSVFPEEGAQQVDSFLQREPQARLVVLPGAPQATRRLLPADSEAAYEDRPDSLPTVHDGFFYALIEKS
jgi:16S rRNA (cytosine967-C5)-methyltransferase